jgi:hypothetical protein
MSEILKKDESYRRGRAVLMVLTPALLGFSFSLLSNLELFDWFSLHPLSMTCSVILMVVPSILIRQMKGKMPTKVHGWFMIGACALLMFGWYVIHMNKEMMGKPHLTSIHGRVGVFVILNMVVMTIGSFIFLDWKMALIPKSISSVLKRSHKWGGRVLLVILLSLVHSGFSRFSESLHIPLGLAILAAVALRPIYETIRKLL